MKRKFTVIERALILKMLPNEENILTLRIIKKLKDDFGFSEGDIKELKITTSGDLYNVQSLPAKEIEIGEKGADVIIEALKGLNSNKKLTENHLSLYEDFVEKVS